MPSPPSSPYSSKPLNEVVYSALNGGDVTVIDLAIDLLEFTMSIFIILLNYIVLDTLIRRQAHINVLSIFICSLATSDVLNGVLLLFIVLYQLVNYQSRLECLIRMGFAHCLLFVSIYHLVALTFDRYLRIMKPLIYKQYFTPTVAAITCLWIWFFGLLFGSLPAMGWSLGPPTQSQRNITAGMECEVPVCSYFGLLERTYIMLSVCLVIIPFIIMVFVYCRIYGVARRHAQHIASHDLSRSSDNKARHTLKYTKTVFILLGLYALGWTPSCVIMIMDISGFMDHLCLIDKGNILSYTALPAFANSIVNPVVYAIRISSIHKRFEEISCRKRKERGWSRSSRNYRDDGTATNTRASGTV